MDLDIKSNKLKAAFTKINKLVKFKQSQPQVKSLILENGLVIKEDE